MVEENIKWQDERGDRVVDQAECGAAPMCNERSGRIELEADVHRTPGAPIAEESALAETGGASGHHLQFHECGLEDRAVCEVGVS